jgi:gliding motility-associated-like protein
MNVQILVEKDSLTLCVSDKKYLIKGSSKRGKFVARDYLNIIQSDEVELDISKAGEYVVIFEQGFKECYTSDTLIVTVENTKILILNEQQNACEVLDYKPEPFNEFAEYKINGKVETDFPIKLPKGDYEVIATLVDVCDTKELRDTFRVFYKDELKIIMDKENRVCVNSEPVLLTSTIEGAVFSGDHLRDDGEKLFFDPKLAGVYTINLTLPLANCIQEDNVSIEVIGLAPQIDNVSVCQEIKSIVLKGEPEGGTWKSTTCGSCVVGNTFVFNNIDQEYQYQYTLTNDIGCVATDIATIYILSPKSDFILNTPPCSSGIDFDLSKSIGEEYTWKIDGESVGIPPFIGLTTGEHTIKMISRIGLCYDSSSIKVFIIDPVESAADFNLPHDEHCTPYLLIPQIKSPYYDFLDYKWTIKFNGESTEIDNYKIDGGFELVNPTPFRIMAQVIFSAGNVCGMVETIESVDIIGIPLAIIGIDSSRYGCSPYTIALSNISQGEIVECIWKVNGKEVYSCDPYIYQTFVANDTVTLFPIELEVSNECGRHKAYDTITVSPPWINVFFNTDEYEVCPNTPITFEDATTPAPIYWKWDFGNGKYSDEQNPTIEYSQPGTYYITLKASTGCGYDSITRPIIVKNAPNVDFILPVYACQNQSSDTIVNLSDYVNQKFVWDFGNGVKDSTTANPTPVFADFGNYIVSLTVTDKKSGCRTSLSKSYEIKAQPQINILLDSIICYGKELNIPNNTLYANNYTWYYDQIAVHAGKDPLIVFKETGEHYIQLVASYNDKCVDSISKVVFIRRCDVFIPNLFTPNNDGKDDFFTAFGGVNTSLIRSVKIFDRWGEMVFSKENFPLNVEYLGWDGSVSTRSKSYGLNSTVFVYMIEIEFTDGTREVFSGDVTLLR